LDPRRGPGYFLPSRLVHAKRFLIGAAMLALSGCANPPDPAVAEHRFHFIRSGVTTREAIMLELGAPTSTFEAERISTWQYLLRGENWHLIVHSPPDASTQVFPQYSLVVIFGPDGVVSRWKLVPLEQPAYPPGMAP